MTRLSDSVSPAQRLASLRILDANFNRANEGLRVLEEYCRFALNDAHLTRLWKDLRHSLAKLQEPFPPNELLHARDTTGDVGRSVKAERELRRESNEHVARASCKRLEQALRSLEEYAKVLGLETSAFESVRYQVYTLEKATVLTGDSQQKLAHARLYVLLDGRSSAQEFEATAREICQAGADIVQLRDKNLADRELLQRARILRIVARESGTVFIMNDRPDLALLASADGVHVGQDELDVQDVRRIVGPDMLIGVSTHNIEQVRAAVLAGASYLGCGPTFPSGTKQFDSFPGLPFLRQVAADTRLPAFAIGGITRENVGDVLATGMRRVAVGGSVTVAENPGSVVEWLRKALAT